MDLFFRMVIRNGENDVGESLRSENCCRSPVPCDANFVAYGPHKWNQSKQFELWRRVACASGLFTFVDRRLCLNNIWCWVKSVSFRSDIVPLCLRPPFFNDKSISPSPGPLRDSFCLDSRFIHNFNLTLSPVIETRSWLYMWLIRKFYARHVKYFVEKCPNISPVDTGDCLFSVWPTRIVHLSSNNCRWIHCWANLPHCFTSWKTSCKTQYTIHYFNDLKKIYSVPSKNCDSVSFTTFTW